MPLGDTGREALEGPLTGDQYLLYLLGAWCFFISLFFFLCGTFLLLGSLAFEILWRSEFLEFPQVPER